MYTFRKCDKFLFLQKGYSLLNTPLPKLLPLDTRWFKRINSFSWVSQTSTDQNDIKFISQTSNVIAHITQEGLTV